MNLEQYRQQDEELKNLAIAAQRYPAKSPQRRTVLTQLVDKIQRSYRLHRPVYPHLTEHYEEIYQIALQKLFLDICQRIESYQPEKAPVIRWANFLLKKRCFNEALAEFLGHKELRGETLEELEERKPFTSFDGRSENNSSLPEMLWKYLEEDPENILQEYQHPKFPQISFQDLAKRRMQGEKWKEISADLDVKVSTLSDFFQRSLQKIAPQIRKYFFDN